VLICSALLVELARQQMELRQPAAQVCIYNLCHHHQNMQLGDNASFLVGTAPHPAGLAELS